MKWKEGKDKRRQIIADKIKAKEEKTCTFEPRIDRSQARDKGVYKHLHKKSIEKFISRQAVARQIKRIKEEEKDTYVGSGKNWENQVTKPMTPKLRKSIRSADRSRTSMELGSAIKRSKSLRNI